MEVLNHRLHINFGTVFLVSDWLNMAENGKQYFRFRFARKVILRWREISISNRNLILYVNLNFRSSSEKCDCHTKCLVFRIFVTIAFLTYLFSSQILDLNDTLRRCDYNGDIHEYIMSRSLC